MALKKERRSEPGFLLAELGEREHLVLLPKQVAWAWRLALTGAHIERVRSAAGLLPAHRSLLEVSEPKGNQGHTELCTI